MTEPGGASAELAFAVRDQFQRQGIGTFLFHYLVRIARDRGIRHARAAVLAENQAMMRVFTRSGLPVQQRTEEGVIVVEIDLSEPIASETEMAHT
jgi:GNAT superfamily N-acetyltransferase